MTEIECDILNCKFNVEGHCTNTHIFHTNKWGCTSFDCLKDD